MAISFASPGSATAIDGDIGSRLVHLIDGLHSSDDLSPARIESLTGIPVGFDPEDQNRYGFGAMLDDTWACNLASIPDRKGGPPKRLVFSFDDVGRHGTKTVSDRAPEFMDFSDKLRACGYVDSIVPGPRGAVYGHRFVRGGVAVEVVTEREDAQAADIRFRVSRLVVDTDAATGVDHV